VLTAEFAHAVLRFKDFQGRLTSNSKLSRPYSVLQDFPDPGKMTNLSRTFQSSVATLYYSGLYLTGSYTR